MNDYEIFKFRKIDKYLLKSLVNSELYFARPDHLNDPFDCRVDILASLENAISRSTGETRNYLEKLQDVCGSINMNKIKADLENSGVCSFSLDLASSLMWSHYADEHRGACLMYAFQKSFFYDNVQEIIGIDKVDYGDNPMSDWFLLEAEKNKSLKDFILNLIKKVLTVKGKLWKYENEVRIIKRKEGAHIIDRQHLKQICFGLSSSDSDVALVRNITSQYGYKVGLCKMVRSKSSDFGIEPIEI